MPSVIDQRTRFDGAAPDVEPAGVPEFLDVRWPALLADRADLVPGAEQLPLRPVILRIDDDAWIARRTDDGTVGIARADDAAIAAVITAGRYLDARFTAARFADLVCDQVTPVGMMTANDLDLAHGRIGHLLDWWLVLRATVDGRRAYRPGDVTVTADLGRAFTLDDDPAEIREFLADAGFLHLRGVFTADEMARISDDMDRAAPSYSPDDGNSWWATLEDGTEQVVRMQRFDRHSETVAALLADDRFLRIADIVGAGHTVDWATENRIEALFKPLGVVSGISDIPWHKDCSLGRHSYECCALTVGISVTGGGETSGQLRVTAGSHRALIWPSLLDTAATGLPDVALPTETGDVTVHLSCTLHMAQAPTEHPRRVLYTGFRLPSASADDAAARLANRRLLSASREGAPRNTSQ